MGITRAVTACDQEGCRSIIDLRIDPSAEEEGEELSRVTRAIAEQRGWLIEQPGEPREFAVEPLPGYAIPKHRNYSAGRDLCPKHRPDRADGAVQSKVAP